MKFPNWFKIAWWAALTIALTAFLWKRLPELLAGHNSTGDVVAFVVWVGLMLAPVFTEVAVLGFTLKQEVEELKGFIATQMIDVKSAVDARASVTSAITVGHLPPPSDEQLPALARKIQEMLDALQKGNNQRSELPELQISPDLGLMFAARYQIEKAIRELADAHAVIPAGLERRYTVLKTLAALVEFSVVPKELAFGVEQLFRSTTAAIHGEPFTEAQVDFVRSTAPFVLKTLRALQVA